MTRRRVTASSRRRTEVGTTASGLQHAEAGVGRSWLERRRNSSPATAGFERVVAIGRDLGQSGVALVLARDAHGRHRTARALGNRRSTSPLLATDSRGLVDRVIAFARADRRTGLRAGLDALAPVGYRCVRAAARNERTPLTFGESHDDGTS